jgi:hypothetical protein
MSKHRFSIPVADKAGNVVGVRCNRCGKIVEFENHGQIPSDVLAEECIPEGASQAAARIVREATER